MAPTNSVAQSGSAGNAAENATNVIGLRSLACPRISHADASSAAAEIHFPAFCASQANINPCRSFVCDPHTWFSIIVIIYLTTSLYSCDILGSNGRKDHEGVLKRRDRAGVLAVRSVCSRDKHLYLLLFLNVGSTTKAAISSVISYPIAWFSTNRDRIGHSGSSLTPKSMISPVL